jgi:hypothetical protein
MTRYQVRRTLWAVILAALAAAAIIGRPVPDTTPPGWGASMRCAALLQSAGVVPARGGCDAR